MYAISPDNAPSIEELMEALKPAGSKWYQIGLKLKLSGELLHSVESDLRCSPSEDYDRYLEQMLKVRLESEGEVLTWKQVATSLCGVGEIELAEKIAQDHSKAHPYKYTHTQYSIDSVLIRQHHATSHLSQDQSFCTIDH